jgi:hypothetical protein
VALRPESPRPDKLEVIRAVEEGVPNGMIWELSSHLYGILNQDRPEPVHQTDKALSGEVTLVIWVGIRGLMTFTQALLTRTVSAPLLRLASGPCPGMPVPAGPHPLLGPSTPVLRCFFFLPSSPRGNHHYM